MMAKSLVVQFTRTLTLVTLSTIGCRPEAIPSPEGFSLAPNVEQSIRDRPASTGSQVLANEEPGFGGAYIEAGVLNLLITDEGMRAGAEPRLRHLVLRMRPSVSIRVDRANFSYRQLQAYDEALGPYYGTGVAYTGIDDKANVLRIGVVSDEARVRIMESIRNLSIESTAILLEKAQYYEPTGTHDLQDQFRPLWGGLQIKVESPTYTETGTLGLVVQVNGTSYVLTAAHLADTLFGGRTNGTVRQNATGSSIGTVYLNPAAVTSGCPTGKSPCRRTDAMLIQLTETNIGFGKIARPGSAFTWNGNSGTRTFDDSSPIVLSSEGVTCSAGQGCQQTFPYQGDTASKIGAVTGWTGGIVVTAQDVYESRSGVWVLNAIVIEGADDLGDSGGPIVSSDNTRLIGIAFGKSIVGTTHVILGSMIGDIATHLVGNSFKLHTMPVPILGYETHYRVDPSCPSSPDSFDYVLVHGYPNGDGTYETRTTEYLGHSTYWCGNSYLQETFTSSQPWQSCGSGGCRDVWDAAGGSFVILPAL